MSLKISWTPKCGSFTASIVHGLVCITAKFWGSCPHHAKRVTALKTLFCHLFEEPAWVYSQSWGPTCIAGLKITWVSQYRLDYNRDIYKCLWLQLERRWYRYIRKLCKYPGIPVYNEAYLGCVSECQSIASNYQDIPVSHRNKQEIPGLFLPHVGP